jgi:hypothetical protein
MINSLLSIVACSNTIKSRFITTEAQEFDISNTPKINDKYLIACKIAIENKNFSNVFNKIKNKLSMDDYKELIRTFTDSVLDDIMQEINGDKYISHELYIQYVKAATLSPANGQIAYSRTINTKYMTPDIACALACINWKYMVWIPKECITSDVLYLVIKRCGYLRYNYDNRLTAPFKEINKNIISDTLMKFKDEPIDEECLDNFKYLIDHSK